MVALPESMQRRREHGEKKALPGFDARFHCSHRKYEYVFPAEAIERLAQLASSLPGTDADLAISTTVMAQRLSAVCAEFVGAHHFHNFCHVPRIPNIRRYCRIAWDELPFTREKVRESDRVAGIEVVKLNASADGEISLQCWPRAPLRHCRCEVYRCEADTVTVGGKEMLRIQFVGSGFLYNQVSFAVHSAAAASRHIASADQRKRSVSSPFLSRTHVD
jgi:tRNA U38,U39,U40 pseudouridine synthase TruA